MEELDKAFPQLSPKLREEQFLQIQVQFAEIKADLTEEEARSLGDALTFRNIPPLDKPLPLQDWPEEARIGIRPPRQTDFKFEQRIEVQRGDLIEDHLAMMMYHDRIYVPPVRPDAPVGKGAAAGSR